MPTKDGQTDISIYALSQRVSDKTTALRKEFNNMSKNNGFRQNRRETDSDYMALFPNSLELVRKDTITSKIKFAHTKERKRFNHLLTAHAYIRSENIVNPIVTSERNAITGDVWILEWILEEQHS